MRLSQALRWKHKDVIALVGAGGKTTAMFLLAGELAAEGHKVVMAATTHMFVTQMSAAPCALIGTDEEQLLRALPAALDAHGYVLVVGGTDEASNKAFGIGPDVADHIARLDMVDSLIVEGDGSRMRPLKAPAPHEPVIPSSATLVVPIVGIQVLGRPLDERSVHRPEIVAALTGASLGEPVSAQMVAAVLGHRRGGAQHVPPGARIVPLINGVEDNERLEQARRIARHLLRPGDGPSAADVSAQDGSKPLNNRPLIDSVVIGATAHPEPALEVWERTAAIILAAGGATRFGNAKLLLPWGDSTILGRVVDQALSAADISDVIVVIGHERERTVAALEGRPVRIVHNEAWAEGQSSSVRAGLDALLPGTGAAVFLLGDQPGILPNVIDRLQQQHRQGLSAAVVPRYRGMRGNPVLFDRSVFAELALQRGDVGGRLLIERLGGRVRWVDFDLRPPGDIDTPDDYERLRP